MIVFFNNQAFGDMLLGTHACKLYKQKFPDSYITFCIPPQSMLTTNEFGDANEILDIIELQNGIDNVGFLYIKDNIAEVKLRKEVPSQHKNLDRLYQQTEWWSDLGIIKSMSGELIKEYGYDSFKNTETKFNLGIEIQKYPKLTIATGGPLDWNRKLKNDELRKEVLTAINSLGIEYIEFGVDINNDTYLNNLKHLSVCHAYIGPAGSMAHFAAGLGLDTIIVSEVYPKEWLSPEFYHSGYHKTIVCDPLLHCDGYQCITNKFFFKEPIDSYPGNPKARIGFWPKYCPATKNDMSCISNVTAEQIIEEIKKWSTIKHLEYIK